MELEGDKRGFDQFDCRIPTACPQELHWSSIHCFDLVHRSRPQPPASPAHRIHFTEISHHRNGRPSRSALPPAQCPHHRGKPSSRSRPSSDCAAKHATSGTITMGVYPPLFTAPCAPIRAERPSHPWGNSPTIITGYWPRRKFRLKSTQQRMGGTA